MLPQRPMKALHWTRAELSDVSYSLPEIVDGLSNSEQASSRDHEQALLSLQCQNGMRMLRSSEMLDRHHFSGR